MVWCGSRGIIYKRKMLSHSLTSMDTSGGSWLSDLLLEEQDFSNVFEQYEVKLGDECEQELLFQQHYLCSDSYSCSGYSPPLTKQIPNSPSSPSSHFLPFPKANPSLNNALTVPSYSSSLNLKEDHIMAERKRREKLSQGLISLASLIPGLKKMDKASVLGDAIKYVKELQARLRTLEEERKNREVVTVKRARRSREEYYAEVGNDKEALPHVEARVSHKDVLLRIHCQRQKGLFLKILFEMRRLHLLIVNSSILSFGNAILDITLIAQMDSGYNTTINDLVRSLRVVAMLKSMS